MTSAIFEDENNIGKTFASLGDPAISTGKMKKRNRCLRRPWSLGPEQTSSTWNQAVRRLRHCTEID
ncbi:hypothetical protein LPH50_03265 [Xylella taiwanensis]|uniref:Uncharacterized protein n=1 Tax=Xylella taiwanensis TaxID=1444770 RepID=A0ABS8TR91_9GAMM|nr:hypothetical protein [Xylella taiwanensis]MCD8457261.1 hypothetical protein [Xylella taiwanensis]MCD8459671.1 hypothetical protein [Xylella taiwanensis]MCD8461462.1 hypothetical protein [Xylella taiwanensis]MCD8462511.1 hypothetical protein [Xylella taiwanensis]MCD8466295.1 hypothetical protein [Xylella taiwanensis]